MISVGSDGQSGLVFHRGLIHTWPHRRCDGALNPKTVSNYFRKWGAYTSISNFSKRQETTTVGRYESYRQAAVTSRCISKIPSGKKYCAMANIILSSFFVFVCLFISSKVDCNKCFKWRLCNSWGWIVILPHSKRPDVATGWSLFKRRRTEQDSAQRGSCSCLRGWQATKTKTERCHCPHSSSQRRVGG